MSSTLLLIEDDRKIAQIAAKNLEAAGFRCLQVHDGLEGWQQFGQLQPDLVVVDVMLPGMDGLEIVRRIRTSSDVPILMLTARSSDGDKVLGFEIGADDYLTKPFSVRELVARVRALLRRSSGHQEQREALEVGELRIDLQRREVSRAGDRVDLTTLEFDVLYTLASHPGRVFSREALMNQVWGADRVVDNRSIDSLISRVRRKLEVDPQQPRYVQTVWGAGYRFAGAKD